MSDFDNEEFIDVVFAKPPKGPTGGQEHPKHPKDKNFYEQSVEIASAHWSYPIVTGADALRRLYPNHSLVMSRDYSLNIFSLPGVQIEPLEKTPLITNAFFVPLSRRLSGVPGVLIDNVELGSFKATWQGFDFIVYVVTVPMGFSVSLQTYILHDGPEEPGRLLLLSVGAWAVELHEEIWVFDQSYWDKSHELWLDVQKADWKDVILSDDFKKALQKDVYGFFASEKVYKDLEIPWKRGLILYGPPGNGKTISLKAIMKSCDQKGFAPLYVKSFQHWAGEEAGMKIVFDKARQLAPCVVILEDLDSLIHDRNRSFFLNQVDGLQGNDGLLLVGTTNHFDRLDPGLSTRPSRFDRKYKFDDPNLEERKLYAQYWQKKLSSNKEIDFSDQLVQEIAELTERFSFAYLKEAFVSALVTLAGIEEDKPSFGSLIKQEISKLSKQLDKQAINYGVDTKASNPPPRPPRPNSATERDLRAVLDALSDAAPGRGSRRIFDFDRSGSESYGSRDTQALLQALSDHLQTAEVASFRRFDTPSNQPSAREPRSSDYAEGNNTYRKLLDRISTSQRERDMRLARLQRGNVDGPSSRFNFDLGNNSAWDGGFKFNPRGYPSATDTFPVRFNPDEPTGSDLA